MRISRAWSLRGAVLSGTENPAPAKPGPGPVERLVRHDRRVVTIAIAAVVALAAAYTVSGAGMNMSGVEMTRMARSVGSPMPMGVGPVWTPAHAALIFVMWWIMMIAMMTPSAAPMLLLFAAIKRQGPDAPRAGWLGLWFLAGYLTVWGGFSVIATVLQWGLGQIGLFEPSMMTVNSRLFAGSVLLVAGGYQFSGLKNACLQHCRSPARFLVRNNRPGPSGALMLGMHHGAFCLGCCWALMALLFVGGVMNLWWIAALALYVFAEKILPTAKMGRWLTRLAGGGLGLAGGYLVASTLT